MQFKKIRNCLLHKQFLEIIHPSSLSPYLSAPLKSNILLNPTYRLDFPFTAKTTQTKISRPKASEKGKNSGSTYCRLSTDGALSKQSLFLTGSSWEGVGKQATLAPRGPRAPDGRWKAEEPALWEGSPSEGLWTQTSV